MPWSRSPSPSGPAHVEVRWTLALRACDLGAWLTPRERNRVAGLRRAVDADAFASSRVLVRAVVGDWAGVAPGHVVLTSRCPVCGSDQHGRPTAGFTGSPAGAETGAPPRVGWTRSGPVVAVAVAPADLVAALGVDVERMGSVGADVDSVALTSGERAAVAAVGDIAQALDARTRYWVLKEAVLKAAGVGLTVDPRGLELSPMTATPTVLSAPPGIETGRWRLGTYRLEGDDLSAPHLAGVAVDAGRGIEVVVSVTRAGLRGGALRRPAKAGEEATPGIAMR